MLRERQEDKKLNSKDINVHLEKAFNGGGTWSSIAGKYQKNLQYPTKDDWNKLEELFGTFPYKYEDIVYKFNLPSGVTDVWSDIDFYAERKIRIHPTQKPSKLIRRIVEASSNPGDIVLDPFSGSGTTAKVCKELDRHYVCCEQNEEYHKNSLVYVSTE
jgi:site-specific DNA-methyltransferase (adenine-specific)